MNSSGMIGAALLLTAGVTAVWLIQRRRRRVSRIQRFAEDAELMLRKAEDRIGEARRIAAKAPENVRRQVQTRLEDLESRRKNVRGTVEEMKLRASQIVGHGDGR
jgi:uncharacterized protein (TIGR03382 family)